LAKWPLNSPCQFMAPVTSDNRNNSSAVIFYVLTSLQIWGFLQPPQFFSTRKASMMFCLLNFFLVIRTGVVTSKLLMCHSVISENANFINIWRLIFFPWFQCSVLILCDSSSMILPKKKEREEKKPQFRFVFLY
jgi:hypothetical protein